MRNMDSFKSFDTEEIKNLNSHMTHHSLIIMSNKSIRNQKMKIISYQREITVEN